MVENFESEYKKICAIVVTYGRRGDLASRVIRRCFEEGVRKVIVVDNGSNEKSRESLLAIKEIYGSSLRLITLTFNSGSAGGFKKGLEAFYEDTSCEYALLLDDDNLPSNGSICALLHAYLFLKDDSGLPLAVFALRKVGGKFTKLGLSMMKTGGKIDKNSFFGFNVFKILKFFATLSGKKSEPIIKYPDFIPFERGPYGTLFFHKSLIDLIGYPMEELFLYMDDLEYTGRITEKKGRIYLVTSASVDEINGATWKERKFLGNLLSYLESDSPEKIYYAARNTSFLERHIIGHSQTNILRSINKLAYLTITLFASILLGRFRIWMLVLQAIKRGENRDFSQIDIAVKGYLNL